MVTRTDVCTCHHPTILGKISERIEKFESNSTCHGEVNLTLINWLENHDQLFWIMPPLNCSLEVKTANTKTAYHGPLLILLFFHKICQMVICSVRGTYNHVRIYFVQERKTALKLASRVVREAEVILPTFSRGKSILLLNCSLDFQ